MASASSGSYGKPPRDPNTGLREAIQKLVDLITSMRAVMSAPGSGTPGGPAPTSTSPGGRGGGFLEKLFSPTAGAAIRNILGDVIKLSPALRRFSVGMGNIAESMSAQHRDLLAEKAHEFRTSVPLGELGLADIIKSVKSPWVSRKDREEVTEKVDIARTRTVEADQARKLHQADVQTVRTARDKRQEAVTELAKVDRRIQWTTRIRDTRYTDWMRTLHAYQAGGPTAPHIRDVRAARRLLNQANARITRLRQARRKVGARVKSTTRGQTAAVLKAARSGNRAAVARTVAQSASTAASATAAKALGTAASIASTIGPIITLGVVVGGTVLAFKWLVNATLAVKNSMRDYAESVNDSNRHLRAFSGGIAVAFNNLHIGDIRRGFQVAGGTEHTAVKLADAVNRMRDSNVQTEIFLRNLHNVAGTVAARSVSAWQGFVSDKMETLNKVFVGSGLANWIQEKSKGWEEGLRSTMEAFWNVSPLGSTFNLVKEFADWMGWKGGGGALADPNQFIKGMAFSFGHNNPGAIRKNPRGFGDTPEGPGNQWRPPRPAGW